MLDLCDCDLNVRCRGSVRKKKALHRDDEGFSVGECFRSSGFLLCRDPDCSSDWGNLLVGRM